jgi:hypothetical protein
MAPTTAIEVLLGLPPLHVITEAEAQAGIYRLTCSQQWKPKSTNFGHARQYQNVSAKIARGVIRGWTSRKTQGVLIVHSWTKVGQGLSEKTLC